MGCVALDRAGGTALLFGLRAPFLKLFLPGAGIGPRVPHGAVVPLISLPTAEKRVVIAGNCCALWTAFMISMPFVPDGGGPGKLNLPS